MLIDFKFENFRSFKESATFTMEANSSDLKSQNFTVVQNAADHSFKMLKSAVIYGANASGKSNIMRALFEVLNLIWNKPLVDQALRIYDPFAFDSRSEKEPCKFELNFLGPENIKYNYKFSILSNVILEEELFYYPNGKITKLFSRVAETNESNRFHKGYLGDSIGKKEITVFKNQLLLSKFSDDEPHELLTEVFLYFKSYEVINTTSVPHSRYLKRKVSEQLYEDKVLREKVQKLIKEADTKINEIEIEKTNDNNDSKNKYFVDDPYIIFGIHDFFENNVLKGKKAILMSEESTGTQSLFVVGTKVLSTIQSGGVLIVDELDTSLHPFITKMIVMLFQSESVNTNNAQLIFTTHDVSLLDRDLLRRDQVWITEKNEKGYSDLFSLQDFEGLREDTPFEKWYLAGKFGGLPAIKSVDTILD
jgi:AAA15 family ATPase/GTPase